MKNYVSPELEVVSVNDTDVITTSIGTESPKVGKTEYISFWSADFRAPIFYHFFAKNDIFPI